MTVIIVLASALLVGAMILVYAGGRVMKHLYRNDNKASAARLDAIDSRRRPLLYILEDRQPVGCEDTLKYAKWMERAKANGEAVVGVSDVNRLRISTIFIGHDMSIQLFDSPPVVFESLVQGADREDSHVLTRYRYCFWEEAERGHKAIVEQAHLDDTAFADYQWQPEEASSAP